MVAERSHGRGEAIIGEDNEKLGDEVDMGELETNGGGTVN